jgi:hypothetical protein
MHNQRIGVMDLAERAGIPRHTIKGWRTVCLPGIVNLEACFNVLGFDLVARRKKEATDGP